MFNIIYICSIKKAQVILFSSIALFESKLLRLYALITGCSLPSKM